MTPDEQRRADLALVQPHVDALAEHFDAVQIFCTRCEEGEHKGTFNLQLGAGNFFARYGHVKLWCIKQDENTRIDTRKDDDS